MENGVPNFTSLVSIDTGVSMENFENMSVIGWHLMCVKTENGYKARFKFVFCVIVNKLICQVVCKL